MASYNRVVLLGNLTRGVELKTTQSGTAVAEIGLAVNDRVKRNDEWVDDVTFVDVTLWARSAEVAAQYLTKGSPILVEGRLKLDRWETDEGERRSRLRVTADRMQMLGARPSDPAERNESGPPTSIAVGAGIAHDVPF
ncbi:MAG: single-stranded DNA-binding protein [Planctomycetales bacterium]|nr:single-stranded DNA-binding protein [Planctomycetales bacterium]